MAFAKKQKSVIFIQKKNAKKTGFFISIIYLFALLFVHFAKLSLLSKKSNYYNYLVESGKNMKLMLSCLVFYYTQLKICISVVLIDICK